MLGNGEGMYTISSLVFSLPAWGIGEKLDYLPFLPLSCVVP